MLWSTSKAVVSLFMEEDDDSNGRAVKVSIKVAGPSRCMPWLGSPSVCVASMAAAKLLHVTRAVLVF